ncbi:MAG: hypothetical protein MJ252_08410 [archaeon]|nr:hypothetical protein [archaeon]
MKTNKRAFSSTQPKAKLYNTKIVPNLMLSHKKNQKSCFDRIKSLANRKLIPQKVLENIIYTRFKLSHFKDDNYYYKKISTEIICNESSHVVAEFKDYLIYGDYSEFLQDYYEIDESKESLLKLFEYYESCSVIFPNYIVLPESKYIYKNIQRKQRVIDNQQELEQIEEDKKNGKIKEDSLEEDNVFNTRTIDSILNITTTSDIRILMGMTDNKKKNKEIDNDNSIGSLNNLIKEITEAEKESTEKEKKIISINLKGKNINQNKPKGESRNIKQLIQDTLPKELTNSKQNIFGKSNQVNKNYFHSENIVTTGNRIHSSSNSEFSKSFFPKEKKQEKSLSKSKFKYINNSIIKKSFIEMLLFNHGSNDYAVKSFREFNKQGNKNQQSNISNSKYSRNDQRGGLSTISVYKGDAMKNINTINSSEVIRNIINKKMLLTSKQNPPQKIDSYGFRVSKPLTARDKSIKNKKETPNTNTINANTNINNSKGNSINKKIKSGSISHKKTFTNSSSGGTATASINNNQGDKNEEKKLSPNKNLNQNKILSPSVYKKVNFISVIPKNPQKIKIQNVNDNKQGKMNYSSRNSNKGFITSKTQRMSKKSSQKIFSEHMANTLSPKPTQNKKIPSTAHFTSKSTLGNFKVQYTTKAENNGTINNHNILNNNYINVNINLNQNTPISVNHLNNKDPFKMKGIKIKGFDKILNNKNKGQFQRYNTERTNTQKYG